MITVTKKEHEIMVASAQATLVVKCMSANKKLKRGEDIRNVSLQLSVAYCNILALENYETSEFNPEEYFNVMDPFHVTKIFSNVNTINTK